MVHTFMFHSINTADLGHETLVIRLYVSNFIKQILTFYDNSNCVSFFLNFS